MILVPLLRLFATDHVMLRDRDIFSMTQFDRVKDMLREKLMPLPKDGSKAILENAIEFRHTCFEVLENGVATLQRSQRATLRRSSSDGDFTHEASLRAVDASASDSESLELNEQKEASQKWTSYMKCDFNIVKKWAGQQIRDVQKEEETTKSQQQIFLQLLRTGYNIGYCLNKSNDDEFVITVLEDRKLQVRLDFLRSLNDSLQSSAGVQRTLARMPIVKMFLRVLAPMWDPWDQQNPSAELDIVSVKCELVEKLVQVGWTYHHSSFENVAVEICEMFDAQPLEQVKHITGTYDSQDGTSSKRGSIMAMATDSRAVVVAQMLVLIKIWANIPQDLDAEEGELLRQRLFRKDREIQVIIDAADLQMEARGQPVQKTLTTEKERDDFLDCVDEVLCYINKGKDGLSRLEKAVQLRVQSYQSVALDDESKTPEVTTFDNIEHVRGSLRSIDFTKNKVIVDLHGCHEIDAGTTKAFRERLVRRNWSVRQTPMLQLFNAIDQTDLVRVMSLSKKAEVNKLIGSFETHRTDVLNLCMKALDRMLGQLRELVKTEVNPNTAREFEFFRKSQDKKIQDISRRKRNNLESMEKMEELFESFNDYVK
jgi:hypothetical protein